ncbi:hypothetical protein AB0O01_28030 [Streptomyces sp. NPDC093252]|uniref:hypothetical protein n=1 Tax=Streptomyces sp. NPDC093252 TaxID=3154980 RepID=UPI0034297AA1
MSETGQTWQKAFKGEPIEAAHVRLWTAGCLKHPDAPAIANELYVAVLGSGAPVIEMTLSTAGARARITAHGPDPLPLISTHGPGWSLITGLADTTGVTADTCGIWAQIRQHR